MRKLFSIAVLFLLLSPLCWAGGSKDNNAKPQSQQQTQKQQTVQNWTGDGGKGISLTIVAPKSTGLAENQSYLPGVVQREFVDNFSGYSAISVLNYESLGEQYDVLLSGYFDDNAGGDLGHLPETTHMMRGNITRTATGYALQMQVTKTADKMTTASYSGDFTFAELDNRTGIRRASLDLLQKMGVTLTATAQEELARAAAENHVNAQTALVQGISAQKQGTEVAALSYYFQAAAFDPSLREAVTRSSILNVNISSGNIGEDARNDVAWRRDWVARLSETEQYFDTFNKSESMPYTLFYVSDEIKREGEINYRNETLTMKIETHLHGSGIWTVSMERALQAVYDGLNATKRKDVWGLGNWPQQGVTNLNAFARRSRNFSVVFELLNDQNKVIGRQTLQSGGSWNLNWSGRPVVEVNADERKTLYFQNVNVNDITDNLTIQVATVNGTAAETAARNRVLQIRAVTKNEFDENGNYRFSKGTLQGYTNKALNAMADWPGVKSTIPNTIWGDPVISIGEGAFRGYKIGELTIPDSVIYIGAEAYRDNPLYNVTIGNSVISIGDRAFDAKYYFESIIIPNSVTSIGAGALRVRKSITIGANVAFADNSSFSYYYNRNDKKAGTYVFKSSKSVAFSMLFSHWKYKPQ